MAGRPKQGIDYSGWSVDIFDSDAKIDKLLDAKGWKGFGIYFFLCQRAYKTNGYFYEWSYDDCATTARKMGGGINSGTVEETVRFCFQVDLFNQGLFDRWGIITSRGIQRRFWSVLSERRSKTVYDEYWLLKPEECNGLVKVSLKSDLQPTDEHLQPTDSQTLSRKESKVKKSKGKQSKEGKSAAAKPPEPDRLIAECGFSLDLEEAVKDWMTYKAEKRQAYKETGFKNLLSQIKGNAERYGDWAVAQLIRECMASNWQGIIFDRLQKEKNNNRSGTGNGNGVDWSRV